MVQNYTLFVQFANILQEIENTNKRLKIQEILSNYYSHIINTDIGLLHMILHMSTATVYPSFVNLEMNIGEGALQPIIAECTGMDIKKIKLLFKDIGDYGEIIKTYKIQKTFNFLSAANITQLTIHDVYNLCTKLCVITGTKSNVEKRKIILEVIRDASPLESKYIIRLLEGKLKIGLALQTILISLSMALGYSDYNIIKEAYNKRPDFKYLVEKIIVAKSIGKTLKNLIIKIEPGIPLKPMLATPITNLDSAISKFNNVLAEYKYDGERAQIHSYLFKRQLSFKNLTGSTTTIERFFEQKTNDGIVNVNQNTSVTGKVCYNKIFSRNNEDISEKYNELVQIKFNKNNKSYILDGEIVAYENGNIMPFQTLSTRKRKYNEKIEVPVCYFAFDLIYFDGKELIDMPLEDRRKLLHANFTTIPNVFEFAIGKIIDNNKDMNEFFEAASTNRCEGLMIKDLDALYQPSHRSNQWLKLKKDYLDNLGDSFDLVVIGAYFGKGKRTGMYGGFLLGVYNDETNTFEACCKIGTGFSDDYLMKIYKELEPIQQHTNILVKDRPDIFVIPRFVWEIKAASLTLSPIYIAGSTDTISNKGISLRFPRFIRERLDKSPENATTSKELFTMFMEHTKNCK